MTDEKYIANQKNYIRRELREIIRTHAIASAGLLFLIAVCLFAIFSMQTPERWSETSFTLSDFYTMRHRRGFTLELIAEDGRFFTVLGSVSDLVPVLEEGGQYTVVYADNMFRNKVTEMIVSGQEYVSLEASAEVYRSNIIIFLVLILILVLLLAGANVFAELSMKSNVQRIRKYRQRIKTRSCRSKSEPFD